MINRDIIEETVKVKFGELCPLMGERMRRCWAAAEAKSIGHGGISMVARSTGLSRNTIAAGADELEKIKGVKEPQPQRIRNNGGGRKAVTYKDPTLLADLEALVEPVTRGDPESALRWTCKSTRRLAEELRLQGHAVGDRTVSALLHDLGYSLQSNRKRREGGSHPDRNAQFEYINAQVQAFQKRGEPAVSVDTKKKELVGNFKNNGQEWQPKGSPEDVDIYDFKDKELGKAIPYGIYDMTRNQGWPSVGIDHDTAYFATGNYSISCGKWPYQN